MEALYGGDGDARAYRRVKGVCILTNGLFGTLLLLEVGIVAWLLVNLGRPEVHSSFRWQDLGFDRWLLALGWTGSGILLLVSCIGLWRHRPWGARAGVAGAAGGLAVYVCGWLSTPSASILLVSAAGCLLPLGLSVWAERLRSRE